MASSATFGGAGTGSGPQGILLSNKPIVLWFHDPGVAFNHDVVVNPDHFPHIHDGQLLCIHFPRNNHGQRQHPPQKSQQPERDTLIAKAACVDRETLARQQQLQVSITKDIAERFNLRFRPEVYVEMIDPAVAALDHVELAFKEQYIGRSDMWRLQQQMVGTCVYVEKKLLFAGAIKATVKKLWANDREVTSGYIHDTTRVIFRSASAKYFVFIQMSREMWEFDEDGELYFEKVVNNFLPHLFSRWKNEGTNHVVSIVLFTRVFYDPGEPMDDLVQQGDDGRYYKDFYKVLADWETTDDWMSIIGPLKREQLNFQPSVLMCQDKDRTVVCGRISMAYEGNLLEAVNLALNPFDKHYVDRDLMRTGLSVILITPGAGKFSVNKKLLRLTNERMTDNGIAMDLVCLSPLPLHITPLLFYTSSPPLEEPGENNATTRSSKPTATANTAANSPDLKMANFDLGGGVQKIPMGYLDPLYQDDTSAATHLYYSVPHWIDCSFYHHETGRFLKQDKYKTRCKMYELQMMGIMEHDIARIHIPFLSQPSTSSLSSAQHAVRQQRSSSSLNDTLTVDRPCSASQGPADTSYLSRSANFSSMRRASIITNEIQKIDSLAQSTTTPPLLPTDFDDYDSSVFKDSAEPRFNRRIPSQVVVQSSNPGKLQKTTSLDITNDRPDINKSTTWHHGESRRVVSLAQQTGNKVVTDGYGYRKDEHHLPKASEIFKGSPLTYNEMSARFHVSRRSTMNSNEVKSGTGDMVPNSEQVISNGHTGGGMGVHGGLAPPDDDDSVVVSSSTVDPMPINNKGIGRLDTTKTHNHSPRQTMVSGSLPSIHKQSGNSDLIRTSLGGAGGGPAGVGNRSSPSHNWHGRSTVMKYVLINPCNPADHNLLFTSHLRRWQHALPKVKEYDGPVVYWKSLSTPACLPLTTDYFPSSDELKLLYNHYMYTVSASEDANLYQAGDRSLPEHQRTENLLTEMISQRLAQGFQIIVDITGSSFNQSSKPKLPDGSAIKEGATKEVAIVGGSGGGSNSGPGSTTAHVGTVGKAAGTVAVTVTGPGASAVPVPAANVQEETDKSKSKQTVWWLSMGHQVHQLTFDSSGQNVEVRRYVRTIDFDIDKMTYKCAIWPKNLPAYRPKTVSFSYPTLLYAWNYLDHLVAGYQEDLNDNLRFWRARFIVIPREQLPSNAPLPGNIQDNLDEEEKRLMLFETWMQTMRKAMWLTPREREEMQRRRRKEFGFSDFGVKLTTMDPSAYLASEAAKALQPTAGEPTPVLSQHSSLLSSIGNLTQPFGLSRESKSKDIAVAMRDPKAGLKIIDRRWHFKVFRQAFIGSEFVDWLVSQLDDIHTREEATAFGNALMQRKPPLFVSSTHRHSLLDGHYFYRLHDEFAPSQLKTWFMNNTSSSRKSSTAVLVNGKEKETAANGNGATSSAPLTPTTATAPSGSNLDLRLMNSRSSSGGTRGTTVFEMSNSMIIDIDPYKKSGRRETAILHYDTLHNPNNCYHFQLNWLGCTAQLMQELLQNWSRQADRCGLKVVEGSCEQAYEESENDNPFQSPVPIRLARKPPPVAELATLFEVPEQCYEIALVRHLGFVLDVEADARFERARAEGVETKYSYYRGPYIYDQYIHRSGVAFVQIRSGGQGFYWVNNRLYTNHTPALVASRRRHESSSPLTHPDHLRQRFEASCGDAKWLTEFWETTRMNLLQSSGQIEHAGASSWVFENAQAVEDADPATLGEADPTTDEMTPAEAPTEPADPT